MENLQVGNQPIESPHKEPFIVHFSIDKNGRGGLVVKKYSWNLQVIPYSVKMMKNTEGDFLEEFMVQVQIPSSPNIVSYLEEVGRDSILG